MTVNAAGDGTQADAEELTFLSVTGDPVQVEVTVGPDEAASPPFLVARRVQLPDGPELRHLRVAWATRKTGYERLDNEILAGLRLLKVAEMTGYPPEVSRLHGYEATSADPCALLEPYRGDPLTVAGQHLLENEQHQFQVSLLTGLCWLAAAGIAHRGIAPSTVRWDGRQAQITDFSMSTLIGVPREAIGTAPWAAREQRAGYASGRVSAQDDIWAAGRLIFYIHAGEELTDRRQIDERPALKHLLAGVFGPPEERPTAREMLSRLNEGCPAPGGFDHDSWLDAGRKRFYGVRAIKHPGTAAPDDGDGEGLALAAAVEPPGPAGTAAAQVGELAGPPRSGRRLMRRFPPSLIAAGLAMLRDATITSLVR
jgi:serine/threonine protein kinase